jgi:perosamine synthetase
MKIPVCIPYFDQKENEMVSHVMSSGWIARGPEHDLFEKKLAEYLGVKYVVALNSGTTALEVALRSLGIKNKEVITTATSCAPTANGIIHSGNKPRIVDVLKGEYTLDPKKVEKAINKKTGAIMPVHIYGRPARMDAIMKIAREHNLPVIEDCAQSMGAKYQGKLTGTIGTVGCFSLNINKIITTGEGGFIATDDQKIAETAKMIRNYGRDPSGTDYCYTHFGHNFKLTNLQAAVGLAQLEKIGQLIELRRKNGFAMLKMLESVKGIELFRENPDEMMVFFSFPVVLKKKGSRDQLKRFLEDKGIEVRTMFRPMCDQPYYVELYKKSKKKLPVAESIGENGFYVGCYPGLTMEQMTYLTDSIKEGLNALDK